MVLYVAFLMPYYVLFSGLRCLHVIKLVLVRGVILVISVSRQDFDSDCTSSWSLFTIFTFEWSNIYNYWGWGGGLNRFNWFPTSHSIYFQKT